MIQDILTNLDDVQTRARLSRGASERAISRVTRFGVSLGSTLTEMASGAMLSGGMTQRLASEEPLSSLREQMTKGIAVFPRTDRVTVNNYGVFVPLSVLGQESSITHEERREVNGSVRITIFAHPRGVKPDVRIGEPVDFTREQTWLKEHHHEYVGEWVALDGDRLLAHGPDAREVYDKARGLGVRVPSVVRIEPPDELAKNGGVKQSPYRVSRQRAEARESLEREFKSLAERWRNETTHLSIASEKANNFAYQQIVGMGEEVLPLIFRELETTTSDWFWALRAIARDRAPVIRAEDRGRVRRIAEIWMEWGKQNGYVSG